MAPTNWQVLAKNHLGNRAWVDIRQAWATVAIGFDLSQNQDLSTALHPILSPGFEARPNVSVINFPGRRVAGFMDAVSAAIKAAYILRNTGNCILSGQPTWAAIDAYHFSFVAARALLGMLGVHFVHVRDSYAVLDVFPEGETEREQRKFQRIHSNLDEPCSLIFRSRSAVIEQRAVWTILIRALRATTFDSEIQNEIGRIIELSEGFAATRNDVLYQNITWIYDDDFLTPYLPSIINDDPFTLATADRFFDENDSGFAFAMLLLTVVRHLIISVEDISGSNVVPTSYGLCFRNFSGFSPAQLHSVFSALYHRDGYGIAL